MSKTESRNGGRREAQARKKFDSQRSRVESQKTDLQKGCAGRSAECKRRGSARTDAPALRRISSGQLVSLPTSSPTILSSEFENGNCGWLGGSRIRIW